MYFRPGGTHDRSLHEVPGERPPKIRKNVSAYAPKRAMEFSPGVSTPEKRHLVVCLEGAWEIEPVDLRFYNQSVKGQPSRLALSCSHVWCWIDDRNRSPFRANRGGHFPGVKTPG